MDKIWYRNPSKLEVIGCCGGNEKTEWPTQNRQKWNFSYLSTVSGLLKLFLLAPCSSCFHGSWKHRHWNN